MAKIVYLYSRINQAEKLKVDPKLLKQINWDGCSGVWDDINKKFVPPNTLDWSWTDKLLTI